MIIGVILGAFYYRKNVLPINQNEIDSYQKSFAEITTNWSILEFHKVPRFDTTFPIVNQVQHLSHDELLMITENVPNMPNTKLIHPNQLIFCAKNSIAFELNSVSQPHILFPDVYTHYLVFTKDEICPIIYSFLGEEIFKIESLTNNIKHVIIKKSWD